MRSGVVAASGVWLSILLTACANGPVEEGGPSAADDWVSANDAPDRGDDTGSEDGSGGDGGGPGGDGGDGGDGGGPGGDGGDTCTEYGPSNDWFHACEEDMPDNLFGSGLQNGQTALNFTMVDQNGDMVELYQFYGQVVVLDLFASW